MKWFLAGLAALIALMVWRSLAMAGQGPAAGDPAPPFELHDQDGALRRLSDYAGRWLVLYFYPKDDTPGCTEQACKFRDDIVHIEALGAAVVGVSVDGRDSHARFARKHGLPFPLLADDRGEVAGRYGALTDLGFLRFAKRHTFLIDPRGRIVKVYRSVDTSRHSAEVIDDLRRLRTAKDPGGAAQGGRQPG